MKAQVIWDDIDKAIEVCTNRFDDDTKAVFTQLYAKLVTPAETTDAQAPDPEPQF